MLEQPEKLNNQAIILASEGHYEEAIECYKRAITLERDNKLLWYNLGLTYRDNGNMTDAEKCLKTAWSIEPKNEEILESYATICFANRKFRLAQSLCSKGLDMNTDNPNFWNLNGAIFFNLEQYEEACNCFESAITLNPFYADALFNLRDTYIQLNNKSGERAISARLKELNIH